MVQELLEVTAQATSNSRHRSRQEHWTIIRALADGDGELLVESCRAHLLPSRDAYLQRVSTLSPT